MRSKIWPRTRHEVGNGLRKKVDASAGEFPSTAPCMHALSSVQISDPRFSRLFLRVRTRADEQEAHFWGVPKFGHALVTRWAMGSAKK